MTDSRFQDMLDLFELAYQKDPSEAEYLIRSFAKNSNRKNEIYLFLARLKNS